MPKGYCIISWQLLEVYWKTAGKFPNNNATMGKCSYWLGVFRKIMEMAVRQQETRQNCPAAFGKNVAISIPFLWITAFLFIFLKSPQSSGKFVKPSVVLLLFLLFPTISLLAKFKLVRQSLEHENGFILLESKGC